MLFQVVEDGFNLWSTFEQFPLTPREKLSPLSVMWWGEDIGTEYLPDLLVQWGTTVPAVTDSNLGVRIHKFWDGSTVMHCCSRKDVCTQLAVIVDTGMQFESVMLTLPIVTRMSVASGYAMVLPSYQPAGFQHGRVHEAKRCFALQDAIQQYRQLRYNAVAVFEKVLVARQLRKVMLVVLHNPVIYLSNGLLLTTEEIKGQDGNNFAVAKCGLTATSSGLYW